MKRLAILFTIFILGIIVAADLGLFPSLLHHLYDFPLGDKAGHFILFGLLTFFIQVSSLDRSNPQKSLRRLLATGLLLALLISIEEWSQLFFPSRTFDLIDLVASLSGVAIGSLCAGLLLARHTTILQQ